MFSLQGSIRDIFPSGPNRMVLEENHYLLCQNFSFQTMLCELRQYDLINQAIISSTFFENRLPFELYRVGDGKTYAKDGQNMIFLVKNGGKSLELEPLHSDLIYRQPNANGKCLFSRNHMHSKWGLFDLEQRSILFEVEDTVFPIYTGEYIYGGFQDLYIARYDETNGGMVWKYLLCENADEEVQRRDSLVSISMDIIGLYGNLFLYYAKKEHKLLAIDNHSGKLNWTIDFMKPINNSKFFLEKDKLYYLYWPLFMSIDVAAGKILEYVDERKLRADPRIIDYSKKRDGEFIHDGLIYFSQGLFRENQDTHCIGIFDPKSQETIWQYKIPVQNRHTTFGNFQVNAHYLCFTSSEGKMYIFKRDQNSTR